MRRARTVGLVLAAAVAGAPAVQAQTFFGMDLHGAGTANSDAARNNFFASLIGVGTETFEGFPVGTSNPVLTFPGAGTATLAGGGEVDNTLGAGRFPISGTQYYEAVSAAGGGTTFNITFASPVAAFGFFGTDIGDFLSQLSLEFGLVGGGTFTFALPYVANSTLNANRIYAGYINTGGFTSVAFRGTDSDDFFGFDDMTIGSIRQVALVPEPGTVGLVLAGLAGLAGFGVVARRRRA